ncbi:MAG: hypothetical protein ACOYM3_07470 [Terrimicrobiaceae bacterium]
MFDGEPLLLFQQLLYVAVEFCLEVGLHFLFLLRGEDCRDIDVGATGLEQRLGVLIVEVCEKTPDVRDFFSRRGPSTVRLDALK